ncbi:O-antigen/teichoic acid export membrane protein [Microbacterium trichothecenolyticum]|uniref:hypothetical protein n=1 Tax=Microbacterium trichothecenolyticum TaxID=69370 RepID=UPI00285943CB|nr:hypothetical protein [Microbacterium trichothecenolyticum]MDR7112927.1 O-antigen/teichoic acid export membrane protein [Microbacterium trichothecenolyticum]
MATLSQVLSSASNFVLSIALARSLSLAEFGQVSLALATATLMIAFSRTTIGQVLILHPGGTRESAYLASQFYFAGASVLAIAAVAAVTGGSAGFTISIALGAGVALVVDGLRYVTISRGDWANAVVADAVWLCVTGVAVLAALLSRTTSASLIVACWGAGAAASALVLAILLHRNGTLPTPSSRGSVRWLSSSRSVVLPLVGESSLILLSGYAVNIAAAALGGYSALGLLRSAQIIMTPVATVVQAFTLVIAQSVLRQRSVNRSGLRQAALLAMVLQGVLVCWTAILLVPGIGDLLLADSWEAILPLVGIVAFGQACANLTAATLSWTRAAVSTWHAFRFRLTAFWIDPAMVASAAALLGSPGPVIGTSLSQATQFLLAAAFAAALYGRRFR